LKSGIINKTFWNYKKVQVPVQVISPQFMIRHMKEKEEANALVIFSWNLIKDLLSGFVSSSTLPL
jgi:hypothetical protein